MYTDDAYYESEEFKETLEHYGEAPTLLDADELTDVADYYLGLGDDAHSEEAIALALEMYPHAAAPLSFKAREALERGDTASADRIAERIEDKENDEYLLLHAEILIAKDCLEEAQEELQRMGRCIEEGGCDSMDSEDLAIEAANMFTNYNLFREARYWIDKAEDREDPDYLELVTLILLGEGKANEALDSANKLLDHDAFSKRSWHILASAQFSLSDYEKAIESLDYALAIDPSYSPALYLKANSLYNLGEYEQALVFYQQLHKDGKADCWTFLNEGTCLLNLGRYEEAAAQLQEAERMAYDTADALATIYKETAFAQAACGHTDLAFEYLAKARREDCEEEELDMLKGYILLQAGDFDKALAVYIKLMEDSGCNPQTLLRIAVSLLDNKHPDTAYIFFQILLANNADDEDFNEGYAYMALCCQNLNRTREFLHYLLTAAKKNPDETKVVLGHYFPEGMPPENYYSYLKGMMNKQE